MKLTLPFPPTVNTYYRSPVRGTLKGKHLISEMGRKFKKNVMPLLCSSTAAYRNQLTSTLR